MSPTRSAALLASFTLLATPSAHGMTPGCRLEAFCTFVNSCDATQSTVPGYLNEAQIDVQMAPLQGTSAAPQFDVKNMCLHISGPTGQRVRCVDRFAGSNYDESYNAATNQCDEFDNRSLTMWSTGPLSAAATLPINRTSETWWTLWQPQPPCQIPVTPGERVYVTAEVKTPQSTARALWDGYRMNSCSPWSVAAHDGFGEGKCSLTTISGFQVVNSCLPERDSVIRLYQPDRYGTAARIGAVLADERKRLGRADTGLVVVASGTSGSDSMVAGTFAASLHGTLVLVDPASSFPAWSRALVQVAREVVVVGGTAAVPDAIVNQIKALAPTAKVSRIGSGADRYDTGAQVARELQRRKPMKTVVVARGDQNWSDGDAGTALAGALGGAVLPVKPTALPSSIRSALTTIKPTKVFVLGGTAAVSDSVLSAIKAAVPGAQVSRVTGGSDRFGTAAAVSRTLLTQLGKTPDAVVLVSSDAYAEPSAAAALATEFGAPILLVTPDGIPSATSSELAYIRPARIFLIGSFDALPVVVEQTAGNYLKIAH